MSCLPSKCYHSHIQLVMEGEKGGDRAAMDEAWSILEEVLEVLDTRAEVGAPATWCGWNMCPTCIVGH